jgi:DNA-binding MarR family transcriptional regulator
MSSPARPAPASQEALDAVGQSLAALLAAARRLRGRETHRSGQLSYAQYGLLFNLAEAALELSSTELARQAALSPATVAQMLDGLEAAGLVVRRRAEHDKRVVLTSLTPRGAEVVAERRAQLDPCWRAMLSDFDEDELRHAAAVMERVGGFFDAMLEDDAGAA